MAKTQYLWPLHPIFSWVNDKAGLFYDRDKAPLIAISGSIQPNEMIFVMTGSMPNRKSTPLVDEMFGLVYRDGTFVETLPMSKIMQAIGLKKDLPNIGRIGEAELAKATCLLADAVSHAKEYLETFYNAYQQKINPMLDEEVDKLAALEKKHKDYQLSLFENERKKSEAERRVDALFENFTKWVKDSMTIENNPYIRVLSVFMGV